jgi:hypothetical protein
MAADEYRRHAAEFFRLAEVSADNGQRAWFVELAQAWLGLAEQAEKNRTADLWYETPARHNEAQRSYQQQQQPQPKPGTGQ